MKFTPAATSLAGIAGLVFLCICGFSFHGDNSQQEKKPVTETKIIELPKGKFIPPRLTLQQALPIAENAFNSRIDKRSDYYLSGVRFFVLETNNGKQDGWLFTWQGDPFTLGMRADVFVSMERTTVFFPGL